MVLYMSKFVEVGSHIKCSSHTHRTKWQKDTTKVGSVGYVCYLDYGDGIMGVHICLNWSNFIHWICEVLHVSIVSQ